MDPVESERWSRLYELSDHKLKLILEKQIRRLAKSGGNAWGQVAVDAILAKPGQIEQPPEL